jgi:hypothetical protein
LARRVRPDLDKILAVFSAIDRADADGYCYSNLTELVTIVRHDRLPMMSRPNTRATFGWSSKPAPAASLRRRRSRRHASAAIAAVALVATALLIMRSTGDAHATPPLAITYGASDQHQCDTLIHRTVAATNQIDFGLRAAEALRYGCLEYRDGELTPHTPALFGHIVRVAKVGIDER